MRGKRFTLYALAAVALVFVIQAMRAPMAVADTDPDSDSGWWDDEWGKRAPVTISGDHPENYQIAITVTYDDDMDANYDDIRFLENSDATNGVLDYWIENLTASTSADIWVRRIENSDQTIYMYYSNGSAPAVSNENAAMVLFDNFNGDSIDSTKWTEVEATGSTGLENELMKITPGTAWTDGAYTTDTYDRSDTGYKFTWQMFADDSISEGLALMAGYCPSPITNTPGILNYWLNTGTEWDRYEDGASNDLTTYAADTWYTVDLILERDAGYIIYIDDGEPKYDDNSYTQNNNALGFTNGSGRGENLFIDNVVVRKYLASEPTASIGTEQSAGAPPGAPETPWCENQTTAYGVSSATPYFNAIFIDNTASDTTTKAHVQVGTSAGDNDLWDSDWVTIDSRDNNTRSEDITYAGATLSRSVIYYWRIRFQDSSGLGGAWSADQSFKIERIEVTAITASADTIDRDVDDENSGVVDNLTIYVSVEDNMGRDWIENCFLWIRDNTDAVVTGFDNVQLDNYENIDANTKKFSYADFNPGDSLGVGTFDVQAQAVDNSGDSTIENTNDYDGFGHTLFVVDDLTVTIVIDDDTPIYQVGVSGVVSRVSGDAVSTDNAQAVDNFQSDNDLGPFALDNFIDNEYNDNFPLNTPSRLYRNDNGSVVVWARDDNLDGVSAAVTYVVEADNATVALSSVSNNPDNSTVNVTVTWDSDSANATSGSTYVVNYETFTATIATGTSGILIDHPTWFYSGAAVVKIYDNADRPLWNVSGATFSSKAITYTTTSFTGDQDNAMVKVTLNYKDNTVPITAKIKMRVNDAWYPENTPDENGLVTWENVDLPDNTENIQIVLENCYDTRTDILVGCKDVEDQTAYWENTNVTYGIDNDNQIIDYNTAGTISGSVTSKASYITLYLVDNLVHDNGDIIDNTTHALTPGENESWSLTHTPLVITNYSVLVYTENSLGGDFTPTENDNVWLWPQLAQPSTLFPDNENGSTDTTPTFEWSATVTAADNYLIEYAENDENFGSPTQSEETDNSYTTTALDENLYYWRVRAQGVNLQPSEWVEYKYWVDATAPSLDNFTAPSSVASTSVTLTLGALDNAGEVYQVRIREGGDNFEGATWQTYSTSMSFTLSTDPGDKTLYAQVVDYGGNTSGTKSLTTTYSPPGGASETSTTTTTTTTTTVTTETNPPTLLALTPIPTEVSVSSFTIQVSADDDSMIASTSVKLDNETVPHTFVNGVVTVALIDLSNGSHVVDIVVEDNYNNISTWLGSFAVKLPPTPVPVEENTEENTATTPAERLKVENVENGQEIKFNFVGEVTSITLVPSENVEEMVLTLETHENLSDSTLPAFDNKKQAYCYFETTLRVDGTENYSASVESFRLEFKVEKAWLENENISDVKLYRLVDNYWEPVNTRFVQDDFTFRHYEAEVQGLSLFSVVGSQLLTHIGSQPGSTGEATGGVPLTVLFAGIFTGIGALGGGVYYYIHYRLPKRARVEVRRELKEGPYLQEIKRSFGPLIERRVRELEQKMEIKSTKGTARATRMSKSRPKSR